MAAEARQTAWLARLAAQLRVLCADEYDADEALSMLRAALAARGAGLPLRSPGLLDLSRLCASGARSRVATVGGAFERGEPLVVGIVRAAHRARLPYSVAPGRLQLEQRAPTPAAVELALAGARPPSLEGALVLLDGRTAYLREEGRGASGGWIETDHVCILARPLDAVVVPRALLPPPPPARGRAMSVARASELLRPDLAGADGKVRGQVVHLRAVLSALSPLHADDAPPPPVPPRKRARDGASLAGDDTAAAAAAAAADAAGGAGEEATRAFFFFELCDAPRTDGCAAEPAAAAEAAGAAAAGNDATSVTGTKFQMGGGGGADGPSAAHDGGGGTTGTVCVAHGASALRLWPYLCSLVGRTLTISHLQQTLVVADGVDAAAAARGGAARAAAAAPSRLLMLACMDTAERASFVFVDDEAELAPPPRPPPSARPPPRVRVCGRERGEGNEAEEAAAAAASGSAIDARAPARAQGDEGTATGTQWAFAEPAEPAPAPTAAVAQLGCGARDVRDMRDTCNACDASVTRADSACVHAGGRGGPATAARAAHDSAAVPSDAGASADAGADADARVLSSVERQAAAPEAADDESDTEALVLSSVDYLLARAAVVADAHGGGGGARGFGFGDDDDGDDDAECGLALDAAPAAGSAEASRLGAALAAAAAAYERPPPPPCLVSSYEGVVSAACACLPAACVLDGAVLLLLGKLPTHALPRALRVGARVSVHGAHLLADSRGAPAALACCLGSTVIVTRLAAALGSAAAAGELAHAHGGAAQPQPQQAQQPQQLMPSAADLRIRGGARRSGAADGAADGAAAGAAAGAARPSPCLWSRLRVRELVALLEVGKEWSDAAGAHAASPAAAGSARAPRAPLPLCARLPSSALLEAMVDAASDEGGGGAAAAGPMAEQAAGLEDFIDHCEQGRAGCQAAAPARFAAPRAVSVRALLRSAELARARDRAAYSGRAQRLVLPAGCFLVGRIELGVGADPRHLCLRSADGGGGGGGGGVGGGGGGGGGGNGGACDGSGDSDCGSGDSDSIRIALHGGGGVAALRRASRELGLPRARAPSAAAAAGEGSDDNESDDDDDDDDDGGDAGAGAGRSAAHAADDGRAGGGALGRRGTVWRWRGVHVGVDSHGPLLLVAMPAASRAGCPDATRAREGAAPAAAHAAELVGCPFWLPPPTAVAAAHARAALPTDGPRAAQPCAARAPQLICISRKQWNPPSPPAAAAAAAAAVATAAPVDGGGSGGGAGQAAGGARPRAAAASAAGSATLHLRAWRPSAAQGEDGGGGAQAGAAAAGGGRWSEPFVVELGGADARWWPLLLTGVPLLVAGLPPPAAPGGKAAARPHAAAPGHAGRDGARSGRLRVLRVRAWPEASAGGAARLPPPPSALPRVWSVAELDDDDDAPALTAAARAPAPAGDTSLVCVTLSRQLKRSTGWGELLSVCVVVAALDGSRALALWSNGCGAGAASYLPSHALVRLAGVQRALATGGGGGGGGGGGRRWTHRLPASAQVEVLALGTRAVEAALRRCKPALLRQMRAAAAGGDGGGFGGAAAPAALVHGSSLRCVRASPVEVKALSLAWLCARCGGFASRDGCGARCGSDAPATLSASLEVSVEDGSSMAVAKSHDPAVVAALLNLREPHARRLAALAAERGPLEFEFPRPGEERGGYKLRLRPPARGCRPPLEAAEAKEVLGWLADPRLSRPIRLYVKRSAAAAPKAGGAAKAGSAAYKTSTQKLKLAPPASGAPNALGAPKEVGVNMRQLHYLNLDVLHAEEDHTATTAYELLARLREAE